MRLDDIQSEWDLVVIGGGIAGAGVLNEASRLGLSVLLVEQKDFASGTSGHSSKLIHGGLRYLKEGRLGLTRTSVVERERLLQEAPGLVEPLGFLMPVYDERGPSKFSLTVGLALYDLLAMRWQHRYYDTTEFVLRAPHVNRDGLLGGFHFQDAKVDDARLVLRLINDAIRAPGATALNYTAAREILRNSKGEVVGLQVEDAETGTTRNLSTRAIVNATGSWAEDLHPSPHQGLHLRPLRGSHLMFPYWAFPVVEAISFTHPDDERPIFAYPWEGSVIYGTTDVDHKEDLSLEPRISDIEVTYLMSALEQMFPSLDLTIDRCISTFAGVRPVLSRGGVNPSEESREHMVWVDKGLVTVTGGKLTTFRRLARAALREIRPFVRVGDLHSAERTFDKIGEGLLPPHVELPQETGRRLSGRYGTKAPAVLISAGADDLDRIPGTETIWAELPYAAENEMVRHLDDLLLRRVRIGLLTPRGGEELLPRVQRLCSSVLPWDGARWKWETERYRHIWQRNHAVPYEDTAEVSSA